MTSLREPGSDDEAHNKKNSTRRSHCGICRSDHQRGGRIDPFHEILESAVISELVNFGSPEERKYAKSELLIAEYADRSRW